MSTLSDEQAASRDNVGTGDPRLDALIGRLPPRALGAVSYLLQPSSRWVRIPAYEGARLDRAPSATLVRFIACE